jgi:hypothetical protein
MSAFVTRANCTYNGYLGPASSNDMSSIIFAPMVTLGSDGIKIKRESLEMTVILWRLCGSSRTDTAQAHYLIDVSPPVVQNGHIEDHEIR